MQGSSVTTLSSGPGNLYQQCPLARAIDEALYLIFFLPNLACLHLQYSISPTLVSDRAPWRAKPLPTRRNEPLVLPSQLSCPCHSSAPQFSPTFESLWGFQCHFPLTQTTHVLPNLIARRNEVSGSDAQRTVLISISHR